MTGVAALRRPGVTRTRPTPIQMIGTASPAAVSTRSPTARCSTGTSPRGVAIWVPCAKQMTAHRRADIAQHGQIDLGNIHRRPGGQTDAVHQVVSQRIAAGIGNMEIGLAVGQDRQRHRRRGSAEQRAIGCLGIAADEVCGSQRVACGQRQLRVGVEQRCIRSEGAREGMRRPSKPSPCASS